MRKHNTPLLILLLVLTIFSLHCKKDQQVDNIELNTQPLDVIKKHVNGRWQLLYAIGGFSGNSRKEYKNDYIEFGNGNILWTRNDTVIVNTPVTWQKITNSYIMFFDYTTTFPAAFVPISIENKELILSDYIMDGYTYRLRRTN